MLGEVLDVKGCGLPRNYLMTTKSIAAEREGEREHTAYVITAICIHMVPAPDLIPVCILLGLVLVHSQLLYENR